MRGRRGAWGVSRCPRSVPACPAPRARATCAHASVGSPDFHSKGLEFTRMRRGTCLKSRLHSGVSEDTLQTEARVSSLFLHFVLASLGAAVLCWAL